MKNIIIFLCLSFTGLVNIQSQDRIVTLEKLQSQTTSTRHHILIVFAGSDWCKPCIQLDKEILQSMDFKQFQKKHLVLYKADFPYQKKNKPHKAQQQMNESLAELYNPKGMFPSAILLNADLSVVKEITYHSGMETGLFINQIIEEL